MIWRPCRSSSAAIFASSITWKGAIWSRRAARCGKVMGFNRSGRELAALSACPASVHFCLAHAGCKLVQHAVHIFMSVDAAEGRGQLDRFVDDHAIRDFDVVVQLKRADQQV